ncbi:hypothetical protein BpHYR1_012991 [Brachionus plicatilis]|uniref:Uncharacterized protein n=1 Tax=Brachionus plicatilis TaxID=10195 RepID=A0A3M7QDK2_BRAPC|nr:hypothetical protein BpHYR1_012991 [Brachionus plicatilis]
MTKSLNLLKSKQELKTLNLTINELRNFMVDYIKAIYDQIDSHKIEGFLSHTTFFTSEKSIFFASPKIKKTNDN